MPPPESGLTNAELRDSPAWYPLELLPGESVRLLRLDAAAYRSASFLDQRLLRAAPPEARVASAQLEAAGAGLEPCSHYLFHTGHVGSTLLSRLIGAREEFFSLREPALLRAAAGAAASLPLSVTLGLLGRTWKRGQTAVVKATSYVSEIAGAILTASAESAAVLVFAEPLAYLRGILAGDNSRAEARALAAARLARLTRRLGPGAWHSDPRSEGEQVAMSWLCEMLALEAAARERPGRVLWVDFDAFLREPAEGLARILRTLGAEPGTREIEALLAGPIMRQYSKAPEHAYDAALRREVLEAADWEHRAEIARGMQWLSAVARQHAPVEALLKSSARMGS